MSIGPLSGQLRLFSGDDEDDSLPLTSRWTPAARLTQISHEYLKTQLADADPKTIFGIQESLKHWLEITGDPPIGKIDRDLLKAFLAGLAKCRGKRKGSLMTPATIRKHVRHLQPLLDHLGPADRKHEEALGILKKAPYFPRAKRGRKKTNVLKKITKPPFTLAEIGRLLDHADAATLPVLDSPGGRIIPAGDYWRALIVVLYNTGLRISSALALRWDWIHGGWVHVPGEHYKFGDATDLPFNQFASAAIESIRTNRELVFPLRGQGVFKGLGRRWLDEQLERIKQAAGLPIDDGRYFHAFRRSLAVQLTLTEGIDVARFALGHTSSDVTKDHYVGGKPAEQFMARLPQPERKPRDQPPEEPPAGAAVPV